VACGYAVDARAIADWPAAGAVAAANKPGAPPVASVIGQEFEEFTRWPMLPVCHHAVARPQVASVLVWPALSMRVHKTEKMASAMYNPGKYQARP
jgi:hypothetical protein